MFCLRLAKTARFKMDTNFDRSSIPDLISITKIVGLVDGHIAVDLECLQKYCKILTDLFDKSIPVKVIAVGGSTDKGKHLAVNLLINCLSGESHNDELAAQVKLFLEQPPSNSIYFWPQPFLLTGTNTKTHVVLVAHYAFDNAEEECGELEELLMTVSARILELSWKSNKLQLKALEPISQPSSDEEESAGSLEEMCNTSLHVVRCSRSSMNASSEESLQEPTSVLSESATKSVMKLLANVIETVLSENSTRNDITIGGFFDFIQAAANSPQQLRQARVQMQEYLVLAVAQVNKEFPDKLQSWIDEHLGLDNIHEIEIIWDNYLKTIFGEYEQVVDPTVWEDFKEKLEFHGNEYKTSLIITSSGSKIVNDLANQEYQCTGYVSNKTLEQIGNDQLEALDVGDTSLGEFTWEMTKQACTKLLNLHKDLNYKVVLKEKDKFIESLAKSGPDFEQELVRHLNGSGYDPKLIKSIRGKLVKNFRKNIKETFRSVDAASTCSEENSSSVKGILMDDKMLTEIQELIFHSMESQSRDAASPGSAKLQEAVSNLMQVYQEEVESCLENSQDMEHVHEQMINQLANSFCKVLKSSK